MTHRERDILQAAHDAGVTLTVDGDRLRYRAPAGAMTPELRADLHELKPTVLEEYHERAGIFIPSAILALLLVRVYVILCCKRKKELNIGVLISAMLQASTFVCGLFIIVSTFSDTVRAYVKDMDFYMLIAGVAVVILSIQWIWKEILKIESGPRD